MPFYRHAHHENNDGIFIEWHPAGYYEQRLQEIEEIKAREESADQILLRKHLFAEIKLPAKWAKAGPKWAKAGAEWDKAVKDYGLNKLHRELCLSDCPWDGKRIFTR